MCCFKQKPLVFFHQRKRWEIMARFVGGLTPTFNSIFFQNETQERILAWPSFCFALLLVNMPYRKNSHGGPECITNQLHWTTLSYIALQWERRFFGINLFRPFTNTYTQLRIDMLGPCVLTEDLHSTLVQLRPSKINFPEISSLIPVKDLSPLGCRG